MFVRRLLALSALATLVSVAVAQGTYTDNSGGGTGASAIQTITIDIPTRVALHLTETSYALDLNDLPAWTGGAFDGEGCRLLRKGQEAHVGTGILPVGVLDPNGLAGWAAAYGGANLTPYLVLELLALNNPDVQTYPAVVLDNGDVAQDEDGYLKGTLVCFNQKIVQKFANTEWAFTADVTMADGVGQFGIIDRIPSGWPPITNGFPEGETRHLISESTNGLALAGHVANGTSGGATGGWLDDHITELFWFDGTETPGAGKQIVVTYTLTGGL